MKHFDQPIECVVDLVMSQTLGINLRLTMGQVPLCLVLWCIFVIQEFKEGRRQYQQAPQVLFSHKEPPRELQGTDARVADNIGYVTFGKLYHCLPVNACTFFCSCLTGLAVNLGFTKASHSDLRSNQQHKITIHHRI